MEVKANLSPATYLSTYTHFTTTVDPARLASEIELLYENQTHGTFSGGALTLDLNTSPQDVRVYGYNVYNSGLGTVGTTEIYWQKAGGALYPLTTMDAEQLSLVLKKPPITDAAEIGKSVADLLFPPVKSALTQYYQLLLQQPPESQAYLAAWNFEMWVNDQQGWAAAKSGLESASGDLFNFISNGFQDYDWDVVDNQQIIGGPVRGVPAGTFGVPGLSINPVINGGSGDITLLTSILNGFRSDPTNINVVVAKLGFTATYNPPVQPGIKMTFGTALDNPIQFGSGKFDLSTGNIQFTSGLSISPWKQFPSDPTFNVGGSFKVVGGNFGRPVTEFDGSFTFSWK